MKTNYVHRRIILCAPTNRNVRKLLKTNSNFKWVFLSENVSKSFDVKKLILNAGEQIDITDLLQESARLLRESYIEYVSDLDVGVPRWWATTISEKNPFISTTFLYTCYLKVCHDLLATYLTTDLVIFVDNHALRKTILKNYSNIYQIEYIDNSTVYLIDAVKNKLKNIVYKVHYVLNNIKYILLLKYQYDLDASRYTHFENNSTILLRDWVDHRSFDLNGNYKSAYVGKLNEYFRSNEKSVLILPYINNINKKTVKQMIASHEDFIIPHSFLTVKNIFSKLFVKLPISKSYPLFSDLDITYLIKDDFRKDNRRFIDALLYYDIVQNLSTSNICFGSCIYLYENYMDEKIFCMGMRTYYPSTILIGYQHSTAPKMLLSYYFSKNEAKKVPLPDKIITNGHYFTNLFISENYPLEKLITGSAIRYSYLYTKNAVKFVKNYDNTICNILVTPPISINETLELLFKVINAFGDKERYQITVKYHPAINQKIIKKYIKLYPLNLQISKVPVPELLEKTNLLIYTMTGAAVEALYVGVPILHIKSNYTIDLDMFNYEKDGIYSAKNIDEIIEMSDELLQMDEEQFKSNQIVWKKIVEGMFSPVDDTTYKLFDR